MARRRTSSATRVVRVGQPRSAAPIVIATQAAPTRRRSSRRRAAPKRRRSHRRSNGMGLGLGGMNGLFGNVLGGAIFGFAVKQGWVDKLPAIPVIGRTGAAAVALDYYSRHGGGEWAKRAAMAAGVLSGYQLGTDGSIHGLTDASPDSYAGEYGYDAEDQG